MNQSIYGKVASPGICLGVAKRIEKTVWQITQKRSNGCDEATKVFESALNKSLQEVQALAENMRTRLGEDEAAIFEAHAFMLEDPELTDQVKKQLKCEEVTPEYAVNQVFENFIVLFEGIEDLYLKQRVADLKDVRDRLLGHLMCPGTGTVVGTEEQSTIYVAYDMSPSELAACEGKGISGFVLEKGGMTSHFVIMANAMGIPTIIQAEGLMQEIQNGELLILDATEKKGVCVIRPTQEIRAKYQDIQKKHEQALMALKVWRTRQTRTADGKHIELSCNIGTASDLDSVIANGAEGIGLFRTEFLFIDQPVLPSEAVQFESYKKVLEKMNGKRVIIRTLDAGGDKEIGSLNLEKEENPFLGYRAIRICLEQQELFKTQLRAILRASVYGRTAIMFPMIASVEELLEAKKILSETKDELKCEGIPVSEIIEVGMMVEIPSVAILAHQFAPHVDFFSIGTNDLTQYTLAVDRGNEKIEKLYRTEHPAVIRLIQMTIQAAHDAGKWVGVCGESAGHPKLQCLYASMGIDELSMSSSKVLSSRERLFHHDAQGSAAWVQRILNAPTSDVVEALLTEMETGAFDHKTL